MKYLMLSMLMAVAATGTAMAQSVYKEKEFSCAGGTSEAIKSCAESAREYAANPFSYAVLGSGAYILAHANLEARQRGTSGWTQIANHSSKIKDNQGVTFSFNAEWLADKLGVDMTALRDTGFEVRGRIKSVNILEIKGNRRRAKCHAAEATYNTIVKRWDYRKADTQSGWAPAEPDNTYIWKASGTASDVKCGVKSTT